MEFDADKIFSMVSFIERRSSSVDLFFTYCSFELYKVGIFAKANYRMFDGRYLWYCGRL